MFRKKLNINRDYCWKEKQWKATPCIIRKPEQINGQPKIKLAYKLVKNGRDSDNRQERRAMIADICNRSGT